MSFVLVRIDTLEELPIGDVAVFVGSAEWKVDLCLAGDGVDDVHCELAADPHGVRVESLSASSVMVNGLTIQSAVLFANDQLVIGPFEFRVERAGVDSSRPVRQLPVTLHAGVAVAFRHIDDDAEPVLPMLPSASASVSDEDAADEFCLDGLWLVRLGTVELGPMSWPELAEMLGRGELQPSDSVCREGDAHWHPIKSLLNTQNRSVDPSASLSSSRQSEVTLPRRSQTRTAKRGRQDSLPVADRPIAVSESSTDFSRPEIRHDSGDFDHSPNAPSQAASTVAEPQYFIQRRSGEEGPLPRHAVQELVSSGTLLADTPVRLEWNTRWSNAIDLGFAYPNADSVLQVPLDSPVETSPRQSNSPQGGDVRWGLLAPFFYARSALYSVRSLPLKQLLVLLLVCGTAGFAAKSWMNRRARTALTGTVMLDDQPLGDVVVTLTGMQSGEVAAGVADSQGRFRILTISGRLSAGPYRITIQPQAGPRATVPHGKGKQLVPERYALLTTSDVTIDVNSEQADYRIPLTRLTSPATLQYRRSSTRAQ